MEEAEHRQRLERANAQAKLAHRHAAETHERSALQYETFAAQAERAGHGARAIELRGTAAEHRRQADAERAMGGVPLRGRN